jgi:hypothetical protein
MSTPTTLQEFEAEVIAKLKQFVGENYEDIQQWTVEHRGGEYYSPDEDMKNFPSQIQFMFRRGYTVQDCYAELTLTEEMDPRLTEEYALRRMAQISNKYSMHIKGGVR